MLFVRPNISLPLPYDARFTYNGLGKRDAGCIEHMMACDKQLKDFTMMYDEEAIIREEDEDPSPHSYT